MEILQPIVLNDNSTFTRASTANYYDINGYLSVTPASNDIMRMEYDPRLTETNTNQSYVSPYYLIESAATSLITYPRDFDNTVWTKSNSYIIPNVEGNNAFARQNADKLVENTVNNNHYIYCSNIGSNQTTTLSIFAKAAERSRIALRMTNSTTETISSYFDLAAGVVVSVDTDGIDYTSPKASIKRIRDNWYRCSFTVTKGNVNTTNRPRIDLISTGTTSSYLGDGVSGVYIAYAQLEIGTSATSPIPDNTAFVSRASSKWDFDSSGTLSNYGTNVAVTAYDPNGNLNKGLSLEAASTNGVRNNTMAGASAGTPGVLPTNWSIGGDAALSRQVVGTGTEDGIDYVDIRFFGTTPSTATPRHDIYFDAFTSSSLAAASGQVWCASYFNNYVGGSLSGVSTGTIYLLGETSLGADSEFSSTNYSITNNPLRKSRYYHIRLMNNATTAFACPRFSIYFNSNATVDITLRIGLPQCENITTNLSGPTSPIKTSGSAVTRAADISTSTFATRAADVVGTTNAIVQTDVPENDYPAWNSGTTYTIGTYVRYVASNIHKVYVALTNNTGKLPTSNPTDWQDAGSTNAWAMFDQSVQSQTTQTYSFTSDILLNSTLVNTVALMNCAGTSVQVSLKHPTDGIVYNQLKTIRSYLGVTDWYQYYFSPIQKDRDFIFDDIPPYATGTLTIKVSYSGGGTAACGAALIGNAVDFSADKLGVEHGAKLSIQDYSVKKQDDFGNYTIVERNFARRSDFTVYIEPEVMNGLINTLSDLRATPALYIGSDLDKHTCTLTYGFYKDFSVEISYPTYSVCTIQLEGLT